MYLSNISSGKESRDILAATRFPNRSKVPNKQQMLQKRFLTAAPQAAKLLTAAPQATKL
jgi:hypothetical protein